MILKIKDREIRKRMTHFEKICHDSGFKLTHQRMEIFLEVARAGDHPDAENVYRRVRERLPTVSLDTVYRTLWLLKDLGLITTLGSNHHRVRFDANLDRHHHFVCTRCGLTVDFYSEELNEIRVPDSLKSLGTFETAQVEIQGVCRKCSSHKQKTQQRKNDNPIKEEHE